MVCGEPGPCPVLGSQGEAGSRWLEEGEGVGAGWSGPPARTPPGAPRRRGTPRKRGTRRTPPRTPPAPGSQGGLAPLEQGEARTQGEAAPHIHPHTPLAPRSRAGSARAPHNQASLRGARSRSRSPRPGWFPRADPAIKEFKGPFEVKDSLGKFPMSL